MRRTFVGVSLLAMAVDQSTKVLDLMASSRAGSFPQGLCVPHFVGAGLLAKTAAHPALM